MNINMVIRLPFKPFGNLAMAIWPFILISKKHDTPERRNHEKIHLAQWRELWVIGFLPVYIYLYLVSGGYRDNPMERECFENETDLSYLLSRKRFAWRDYSL